MGASRLAYLRQLAEPAGVERRQQPRFACQLPCDIRRGNRSYRGAVTNIADGGFFIETRDFLAETDALLEVQIECGARPQLGEQPVVVDAVAVDRSYMDPNQTSSGVHGFGVRLVQMCAPYRRLVQLIAESATPRENPAPDTDEPCREAASQRYRVWLKEASTGVLWQSLVVSANSEAEAKRSAASSCKDGWGLSHVEKIRTPS